MGDIVFTVHGTNDTAPSDEGEQWWQIGSAFQHRLLDLNAARGRNPVVRPFRWDGANSDVARRRAGARLAAIARRALRDGGGVSLIGHSHGGNVIAYALKDPELASAYRRGALQVVSVGTPFFQDRRRWVSIANESARRTIVSLVLLLLFGLGLVLSGASAALISQETEIGSTLADVRIVARESSYVGAEAIDTLEVMAREQTVPAFAAQIEGLLDLGRVLLSLLQVLVNQPIAVMVVCGAGLIATQAEPLYALSRRALVWLRDGLARGEARRAGVWTAIAHPADEAIALLSAAPRVKLSPMTPQGAARSVRRLTPLIALVAALLAAGLIWTRAEGVIMAAPGAFIEANTHLFAMQRWRNEQSDIGGIPADWSPETGFIVAEADIERAAAGDAAREAELRSRIAQLTSNSENMINQLNAVRASVESLLTEYMAVILALVTAIALLAIWLLQLAIVAVSPLFGRAMSFFANRSVTGAMTSAALGEDGEYVLGSIAISPPARFSPRIVELSEATIERMHVDADYNAGESLRRLRRTIHTAQQGATGDALGDMLTHISWRELIHTSYFEVEEVAEIVADAIAPRQRVLIAT